MRRCLTLSIAPCTSISNFIALKISCWHLDIRRDNKALAYKNINLNTISTNYWPFHYRASIYASVIAIFSAISRISLRQLRGWSFFIFRSLPINVKGDEDSKLKLSDGFLMGRGRCLIILSWCYASIMSASGRRRRHDRCGNLIHFSASKYSRVSAIVNDADILASINGSAIRHHIEIRLLWCWFCAFSIALAFAVF